MNPNPFCLMIFLMVPVMANFSSSLCQLRETLQAKWSLTILGSLPRLMLPSTYIQSQLEFNSLLYYRPRLWSCSSFETSHRQSEKDLSKSEDLRSYHGT